MYLEIHSFYCKINAFSHFYLKTQCVFFSLILISFNYSLCTFGLSRINFISVFPVFFILQVSKSPFATLFRIVLLISFNSSLFTFGLSRINFISVFPVFLYCKFKYVCTSFLFVFPLFCFYKCFPGFLYSKFKYFLPSFL